MNEQNAAEADPLAMPASEQNTDFPLLKPDKIYRFNITKVECVDSTKEGAPAGAQNLVVTLTTTKDELDTKDNVLHSGYSLKHYITLYATGERTVDSVRKDVATFIKAVEGPKSTTLMAAVRSAPEKFENKPVDAKVGISKDKSGTYPDRNSVRFVIPQ